MPYKISPPVKGGEKGIYNFISALAKYSGITIYTVGENKNIDIENVSIKPMLGSTLSKFRYINIFLFFRLKRDLAPKNIHTLIIEHPYFGWLGALLKVLTKKKILIHSHNIESSRFKTLKKWWWRILFYYERWVHRVANFSFFVTEEDRQYAIEHFKLSHEKTAVITYGIPQSSIPSIEEKKQCREQLLKAYGLPQHCTIMLFAAPLQYAPNLDALDEILNKINPIIDNECKDMYRIIVCGGGLPEAYNKLTGFQNVIYAGFVNDINVYFKGVDIFLNPVIDGGGIKTKLVEALAADTTGISYKNGAIGIPASVTDSKLRVVGNGDYLTFANAVIEKMKGKVASTPQAFFEYFNLEKVGEKAIRLIEDL